MPLVSESEPGKYLMLQHVPGFVGVVSGPDHVVQYVNEAFGALVGPRQSIGRPFGEMCPELADQGLRTLLDAVQATGEPRSIRDMSIRIMTLRHAGEDADRSLEFLCQPMRDAAGHITGIFIGGRDITDQMRALTYRDALVRFTDRTGNLLDPDEITFIASQIIGETLKVSRVGYATIDPVLETLHVERDWNAPGIATLAGTLPLGAYGSLIDSLKQGEFISIDDVDRDERTAAAAPALKDRSIYSLLNVPVLEQGQLVAVLFVSHRAVRAWTPDDHTFLKEMASRARNTAERSRNEEELRRLNATLQKRDEEREAVLKDTQDFARLALEAVGGVGVWTYEVDSDLFFYDASIAAIYNIDPARGAGGIPRPEFLANVIPEDRKALAATMAGGLAKAGDLELEYRIRHPDGSVRWVLSRGHTYHDESGKPVRRTGIGVETTSKRVTEEALRQAQKMEAVGQLTGGLAHDFNNLLAGISGSLELMQIRMQQGRLADVDRYLTAAQGATKRAAALTHRLLAFSRRQTLDPKPTDVNRLIIGMQDLIQRTVGPAIPIEIVGASDAWPTLVDPSQLENSLLNLCINARDAMPEGGKIIVETANKWLDARAAREHDMAEGQYLALSVTDTGTGMSPDVIAHAFEPFFTTKPIGGGTGLGLSMIYGFAKQSGGQVRIYSEIGTGTTVCVYLPRHYGDVEAETVSPVEALPHVTQGETVLVVDDEATVRMLITDVLQDLGYNALEAGDSASGLKILQSDVRIDLLVTDVGLPGGMNGRQMADAGRSVRPDLKVLFITGYAENAVLGEGRLAPGMAVLTKPFPVDTMAARIRSMIEANREEARQRLKSPRAS